MASAVFFPLQYVNNIPFIEGSMLVINLGLPSVNTNITGLPVAAAAFAKASWSSGNANSRVLPGLSAYAFSPTHKIIASTPDALADNFVASKFDALSNPLPVVVVTL